MEKSLLNSTKLISISTETRLKDLEDKTTKPETFERGKIWFGKARGITTLSKELYDYLERVKRQLKGKKPDPDSLQVMARKYKQAILSTDSSIYLVFQQSEELLSLFNDPESRESISVMQNNLVAFENKLVNFCNHQVGYLDGEGFFSTYTVLVGQSSNYLEPGAVLEIKAGVGAFSKAAQPKITFDGTTIGMGEEGYALFKKKVSLKPGSYSFPVSILYFDPMFEKEELRIVNVEYTVLKKCGQ